jgi:ATP-dependent protease ClpP protease subunit
MPNPARASVKPFFRAALSTDNVLELMIYEDIGASFDWMSGEPSGVTAKGVKAQIDAAGNYSSIRMRINSPGGDAFEGIAILNILKTQGKPVNVMVDGIAASAASIIAMAGDTIEMGSGAMMMIHNASGVCFGNTSDMSQMAAALGTIDKSIAKTYADRTGMRIVDAAALMSAETWMSSTECVEKGFATGMQGGSDSPEGVDALSMAKNFKAMARFAHVPAELKQTAEEVQNSNKFAVASVAAIQPKETTMAEPNTQTADTTTIQAAAPNIDELRAQAQGESLEIIELCALAGKPTAALDFIRNKATAATVRKELAAANAKASEETTIHSHIEAESSTNARQESPVVAAARRLNEQQKGRAA